MTESLGGAGDTSTPSYDMGGSPTFAVDILIDAPDARLKPGMTAEVSLTTQQLDNVMLPLAYTDVPRREREVRAVHALRAVGLPVDHYDHRTNELSGGQMQRVAIARALVNDPAIILADEPTGNLDSTTGRQVMDTFRALKRAGKTIVLITHDVGIAAEADRAAQIRDGRIFEGAYIPAPTAQPESPSQNGGAL